jgi:hypothetical protein
MVGGLIVRDHLVDDPLDRIEALEARVAELERALANAIKIEAAGTAGATEQAWAQYTDPDGNTAYLRGYAAQ